jgi:hypothetical protein
LGSVFEVDQKSGDVSLVTNIGGPQWPGGAANQFSAQSSLGVVPSASVSSSVLLTVSSKTTALSVTFPVSFNYDAGTKHGWTSNLYPNHADATPKLPQ